MRHATGEANQFTFMKHRHGEGEVVQMAAGGVGIVGDQNITRVNVVVAEVFDLGFDGL